MDLGPGPQAHGALRPQFTAPWALVPGLYPLWLNIRASRATSRQPIGNIQQILINIIWYYWTTNRSLSGFDISCHLGRKCFTEKKRIGLSIYGRWFVQKTTIGCLIYYLSCWLFYTAYCWTLDCPWCTYVLPWWPWARNKSWRPKEMSSAGPCSQLVGSRPRVHTQDGWTYAHQGQATGTQ